MADTAPTETLTLTLEEALLLTSNRGHHLVHTDRYSGNMGGASCWYVLSRDGARLSLESATWPDAIRSYLRHVEGRDQPVVARDDAAELRKALTSVGAALLAAISLLEKTPEGKQHMGSDKMFAEFLAGLRRRAEAGRAALTTTEGEP